jgi:hypothetical protein
VTALPPARHLDRGTTYRIVADIVGPETDRFESVDEGRVILQELASQQKR